jgi:DNA mismatch endonuclease (patch repair protein)
VSGLRAAPSYQDRRSSSERASRTLAATSKVRTTPELLLAKNLWARGLRYRKNVRALPGKPDLVFPQPRVVVFVDGDFWHGRDWIARRARLKRGANAAYWISKIEYNRRRDVEVVRKLRAAGWEVVRVWEGDIKAALELVCDQVEGAVKRRVHYHPRAVV